MKENCLEYEWKWVKNTNVFFSKTLIQNICRLYFLSVACFNFVFAIISAWTEEEKSRTNLEKKTSFKIINDIYLMTY